MQAIRNLIISDLLRFYRSTFMVGDCTRAMARLEHKRIACTTAKLYRSTTLWNRYGSDSCAQ